MTSNDLGVWAASLNSAASAAGIAGNMSTANDSKEIAWQQLKQQQEQWNAAYNFNYAEAEKTREFNRVEAENARDYNSAEAQKAREWESEQAVMQRRKEAGLNTAVLGEMSGGGSGVSASASPASAGGLASAPAPGAPAGSIHPFPSLDGIGESLEKVLQVVKALENPDDPSYSVLGPEFAKMNSDTKKSLADSANVSVQTKIAEEALNQERVRSQFTFPLLQAELSKALREVDNVGMDTALKRMHVFDVSNQIRNRNSAMCVSWLQTIYQGENVALDKERLKADITQYQLANRQWVENTKREFYRMAWEYGAKSNKSFTGKKSKNTTKSTFDSQAVTLSRDTVNQNFQNGSFDVGVTHAGVGLPSTIPKNVPSKIPKGSYSPLPGQDVPWSISLDGGAGGFRTGTSLSKGYSSVDVNNKTLTSLEGSEFVNGNSVDRSYINSDIFKMLSEMEAYSDIVNDANLSHSQTKLALSRLHDLTIQYQMLEEVARTHQMLSAPRIVE